MKQTLNIILEKIYINKDQLLTDKILGKILRTFEAQHLPTLKRNREYYEGYQEIMRRQFSDKTLPNNRLCRNYCREICDNFVGYTVGEPITY